MLREYKTVESYGEYRIQTSEETQRLFGILLRKTKSEHILGEMDWTQRMKSSFKRITGTEKELTSRLLRKYCISCMQQEGKLIYLKERMETAYAMGHDLREQQEVYTLRLPTYEEYMEEQKPKKRSGQTIWEEAEKEELKELMKSMDSAALIRQEAERKGLLMSRRDRKSIQQKMNQMSGRAKKARIESIRSEQDI